MLTIIYRGVVDDVEIGSYVKINILYCSPFINKIKFLQLFFCFVFHFFVAWFVFSFMGCFLPWSAAYDNDFIYSTLWGLLQGRPYQVLRYRSRLIGFFRPSPAPSSTKGRLCKCNKSNQAKIFLVQYTLVLSIGN